MFKRILIFITIVLLVFSLTGCIDIGAGGTKASGGGVIADTDEFTIGEKAVFGFNVQLLEPFDGVYVESTALLDAKGTFQLVDKTAGFRMNATIIYVEIFEDTEYRDVYTNLIIFYGTAVINGAEVDVAVAAVDWSGDTAPDAIQVIVSYEETEIYSINGDIVKGNIKVS